MYMQVPTALPCTLVLSTTRSKPWSTIYCLLGPLDSSALGVVLTVHDSASPIGIHHFSSCRVDDLERRDSAHAALLAQSFTDRLLAVINRRPGLLAEVALEGFLVLVGGDEDDLQGAGIGLLERRVELSEHGGEACRGGRQG